MNQPEDLKRIGDIFTVSIGGTPSRKRSEFWDPQKKSDNIWLSIRDISQNQKPRIMDSAEYISDEGVKNSNVKEIPANTALMTFKLTVGKTTVSGTNMFTNEAIAAFLPKTGIEADPYYLSTVLPTLNYETDQAIKGITLNKAKIENTLIPLPKISKQKRIAEILGSIDRSISVTQKTIEQANRLKKSLMLEFFTKSNQTNLKTLPLKDITQLSSGGTPPKKTKEFWNGNNLWVSPKDMGTKIITDTKDHIHDSALQYAGVANQDDILIVVRSGVLAHSIPISFVDKKMSFNQDLKAIRIRDTKTLLPKYLYHLLSFKTDELLNKAVKRGTTVHSIETSCLESTKVVMLSIIEQNKIVKILESIDKFIETNNKLKAKQEQLKQGLMQDLLTGKVAA